MIDLNKYKLNYIKRSTQTGSYLGMRFAFQKNEDTLDVIVYPEPYCLEKAPEDKKEIRQFTLDEAGLKDAVDWLNSLYAEKESYWLDIYENRMNLQ